MKNLQNLSSEELIANTKQLVAREREVMAQVLWHLREIESRRLFAGLGFGSLYEYAVAELGYSAASAMRRINAMRLLKELPQVEEALKDGKLNLSHLSSVQSFFQQERKHQGKTYSPAEKLDLVLRLEGTSQRETEKILVTLSPETAFRAHDRVRPISESHHKFEAVIPDRILKKLERVKELASHRLKGGNWAEVLEVMADQTIKALDPIQQSRRRQKISSDSTPAPEWNGPQSADKLPSTSRYIPKALKKSIFERAHGQCEYQTQEGKKCSCRIYLQVDHIVPLGLGGTTSADNLRVLCQAHNQWAALQSFGPRKMDKYWARTRVAANC